MTQHIIDEIHDYLYDHKILRTDAEIRRAIESVEQAEAERAGYFVPVESLRASEATWHGVMHEPGGILDLLEVDSEDTLYDRHTGDIPGFEGAVAALDALKVRKA